VLALAALVLPARADAHLVTTGLGPVYDGIGHLLLTPEDLVPALALALYAGLRGPRAGRRALFTLPAAWLAGGLAGLRMSAPVGLPLATISFLLLGVLVAADLDLSDRAIAAIAAGLGLVHGFLDGAGLSGAASGALGLVGITVALFVGVALATACVVAIEHSWKRIAVRVAGSWIAAIGLLLLGWDLRGTR
jgi:hydrogenase/urease accessory protein HupE